MNLSTISDELLLEWHSKLCELGQATGCISDESICPYTYHEVYAEILRREDPTHPTL